MAMSGQGTRRSAAGNCQRKRSSVLAGQLVEVDLPDVTNTHVRKPMKGGCRSAHHCRTPAGRPHTDGSDTLRLIRGARGGMYGTTQPSNAAKL